MLVKVYGGGGGGKPRTENVFTNGSNVFAKGRKRLSVSHIREGHRQAELQKWRRKCDKCWHKIGDWRWDWLRRNWELARTRCTSSSAMIWVSGRSTPDLCSTNSQTSRKQNEWKLLDFISMCDQDPLLLLIAFFDNKGFVHKEFVPAG